MPRNQPIDWDVIYQAIDESPSLSAAARKLGLHFNTVWKATKRREGLCHRCFKHPVVPPSLHCESCIAAMREYMRLRRIKSLAQKVCLQCGAPVAPHSRIYCETHRQMVLRDARNQRNRYKAKDPEGFLAKQRADNRRQKYGEGANALWDSTQGACQICATPYRKRGNHIHHIDHDATNNTPDNLVVVCVRCHQLIHALRNHSNPALVIAWVQKTYATKPPPRKTTPPPIGYFEKTR